MINFRRFGYVLFGASLIFIACGVPEEGRFIAIDSAELPDALRYAPTSVPSPTTTVGEIDQTTTTTPDTTYEPVEMYYVSANRVVRSERAIVSPATPTQVLDTLLAGIDSSAQTAGLRSALPRRLTATIDVRRGIATVSANGPFLADLEPLDQRLAIAQVVLTLTRRPGIGQVIFVVDGAQIQVPRGGGDLAPAGAPVTYDDYVAVLSARD